MEFSNLDVLQMSGSRLNQFQSLFLVEHRAFLDIDANSDDQPIEELATSFHHIKMAKCNRIEGARVDGHSGTQFTHRCYRNWGFLPFVTVRNLDRNPNLNRNRSRIHLVELFQSDALASSLPLLTQARASEICDIVQTTTSTPNGEHNRDCKGDT